MKKSYLLLGSMISFGLLFGMTAYGDEANQQTTIKLSAPLQVPGQVLPAGTYTFQLADDGFDLNLVQIFNSDGTKLYGTFETVATDRAHASSDTTITLAEQGSKRPDALVKWFYPGTEIGHEFIYPAKQQKQVDHDRHETINGRSNGA
jgi:hypothetical protein